MNIPAQRSSATLRTIMLPAQRCPHLIFTRNNGFTLVELLVAILIFGILSMLAYGGLDSVIKSRDRTEAELFRLRQIQITFSQLQRDVEQLTARDGSRDEQCRRLDPIGNDLMFDRRQFVHAFDRGQRRVAIEPDRGEGGRHRGPNARPCRRGSR